MQYVNPIAQDPIFFPLFKLPFSNCEIPIFLFDGQKCIPAIKSVAKCAAPKGLNLLVIDNVKLFFLFYYRYDGNTLLDSVESFDPLKNMWEPLEENMSIQRCDAGVTVVCTRCWLDCYDTFLSRTCVGDTNKDREVGISWPLW